MLASNTIADYLPLLRAAVVAAEQTCNQALTGLQTLQIALAALHLPLLHWPPSLHRHQDLLFRRHRQAQSEFRRALTFLQSQEALLAKNTPAPLPAAPDPKPERVPPPWVCHQTLRVSIENDLTITRQEGGVTDEFVLERFSNPSDEDEMTFVRDFFFGDPRHGIAPFVPPEYEWTLEHNGVINPPHEISSVTYTHREFLRLIELERDIAAPHRLPGKPSRKKYDNWFLRLQAEEERENARRRELKRKSD